MKKSAQRRYTASWQIIFRLFFRICPLQITTWFDAKEHENIFGKTSSFVVKITTWNLCPPSCDCYVYMPICSVAITYPIRNYKSMVNLTIQIRWSRLIVLRTTYSLWWLSSCSIKENNIPNWTYNMNSKFRSNIWPRRIQHQHNLTASTNLPTSDIILSPLIMQYSVFYTHPGQRKKMFMFRIQGSILVIYWNTKLFIQLSKSILAWRLKWDLVIKSCDFFWNNVSTRDGFIKFISYKLLWLCKNITQPSSCKFYTSYEIEF